MPDFDPTMLATVHYRDAGTAGASNHTSGWFKPSTISAVRSGATDPDSERFLEFYRHHITDSEKIHAHCRDMPTDNYNPGGKSDSPNNPNSTLISFRCSDVALESTTSTELEVYYPVVVISAHGLREGGEKWKRLLKGVALLPSREGEGWNPDGSIAYARVPITYIGEGCRVSASRGDDVPIAARGLFDSAYRELSEAADQAVRASNGRLQSLSMENRNRFASD